MESPSVPHSPGRLESTLALAVFLGCLAFHFGGAMVGWQSKNLPGVEYRQAQTALSAFFIKQEGNFSLAYPTPVLGKPWSIPMEFPLYQWTVVAVSEVTSLSLTKSGRAVSMACFYLMLPAIYLLLTRWRVAPGHRWLVLAVVVTCPLYVFYARSFLMETMALMFSLWFWVAFERAVDQRSARWLGVAILAGTGAGMVKVTTYMLYLLPAALGALVRLWHHRRDGRWKADLAWMISAVAIPFAATLWWLHYSDAVKSQNPNALFLRSDHMMDFNLGTRATRLSPEMWRMKGAMIARHLSWWPLLGGCAILALLAARTRWREIGLCCGVFGAALVIFPVLYAFHEYYYIANAVLLMIAMGFVLVALAESSRPRWILALALVTVTCGQVYGYFQLYYPMQRGISQGGDGLSQSLRLLTKPDEVLVITGQDWNSMTAYYAQRRALMLRGSAEQAPAQLGPALASLSGEKIGALVLTGKWEDQSWLIQQGVARGLAPTPSYFWRNAAVFLPADRRKEIAYRLEEDPMPEVRPAPGVLAQFEQPVNGWYQVVTLPRAQRDKFDGMKPRPVRFFSAFGLALERGEGRMDFGAHPDTRLVFRLAAGRHVLHTTAQFSPDAYRPDLADDAATDGVEITLSAVGPGEARQVLDTRIIDPRRRPEDRGRTPVRIEFTLPQAGEVELFVGPGPAGRSTRDWFVLGRLVIE